MNPLYILTVSLITLLYIWTIYNIPILIVGIRSLLHSNHKKQKPITYKQEKLPKISIIIPAKNEENVINRLFSALQKIKYPQEKKEIIIAEGGSIDRTKEICKKFAQTNPKQIQLLKTQISNGKPSALNEALKKAKGEIIAVFDADNVPEPNSLLEAAKYFMDPTIAAVQGKVCSINENENMLTKISSKEEALKYILSRGKDTLQLFVPLTGTCYFVRRTVLEQIGGWDKTALSEDTELAARLTRNKQKIKYAPEVKSWQENPATLTGFFKQRLRWFRGTMEVSIKYSKLLKNPSLKILDAELTLATPFIFFLCLIGYIVSLSSFLTPMEIDFIPMLLSNTTTLLTIFALSSSGLMLIYSTKPRKLSNIFYIPFIYFYWILQNFIASCAFLQILLRRPRKWEKTNKTGAISN